MATGNTSVNSIKGVVNSGTNQMSRRTIISLMLAGVEYKVLRTFY
jgi:hypothetical protein